VPKRADSGVDELIDWLYSLDPEAFTEERNAAAKQLLADAGYPNGFDTTILSWSQYSFLSNAAVVFQEQLKQIGINADVNLEENAAFIKDYLDNNFDLTVSGTSAYVDPNDIYLRNFGTGQPSNAVRYSNPKADDLIAAGWRVLRFTWAMPDEHPGAVIARIVQLLAA